MLRTADGDGVLGRLARSLGKQDPGREPGALHDGNSRPLRGAGPPVIRTGRAFRGPELRSAPRPGEDPDKGSTGPRPDGGERGAVHLPKSRRAM